MVSPPIAGSLCPEEGIQRLHGSQVALQALATRPLLPRLGPHALHLTPSWPPSPSPKAQSLPAPEPLFPLSPQPASQASLLLQGLSSWEAAPVSCTHITAAQLLGTHRLGDHLYSPQTEHSPRQGLRRRKDICAMREAPRKVAGIPGTLTNSCRGLGSGSAHSGEIANQGAQDPPWSKLVQRREQTFIWHLKKKKCLCLVSTQ